MRNRCSTVSLPALLPAGQSNTLLREWWQFGWILLTHSKLMDDFWTTVILSYVSLNVGYYINRLYLSRHCFTQETVVNLRQSLVCLLNYFKIPPSRISKINLQWNCQIYYLYILYINNRNKVSYYEHLERRKGLINKYQHLGRTEDNGHIYIHTFP